MVVLEPVRGVLDGKCRLELLTTGSNMRNVALPQSGNKLQCPVNTPPRGLRSGCIFRSTMGNVALNHEKRRFGSFSPGKSAASAFASPQRDL